ncbi:hypothetical protein [Pseudomonas syringae]|uniref:hypothetical protein n=1 Tax=Pseudomonas syringae TaxID=317 RepID=UPI003F756DBA
MGTITQRKNKKGGIKYTAQIRLKRAGKIAYQEAQSFDRNQIAQAWLKRRETSSTIPKCSSTSISETQPSLSRFNALMKLTLGFLCRTSHEAAYS